MPPPHQHMLAGETMSLQCQSSIQHILKIYAPDLFKYEKQPDTIPGTYMFFLWIMGTATQVDELWISRPLRDAEFEHIETMSAMLANVITPMVILRPNAEIMGFSGPGALQWDLNVDMLCRRLNQNCVAFIQPRPWEKLKFDEQKRILATANNTELIIDVLGGSLRHSHFMTRLRSFRLWVWQLHSCDIVGKDHWMPHNLKATS